MAQFIIKLSHLYFTLFQLSLIQQRQDDWSAILGITKYSPNELAIAYKNAMAKVYQDYPDNPM